MRVPVSPRRLRRNLHISTEHLERSTSSLPAATEVVIMHNDFGIRDLSFSIELGRLCHIIARMVRDRLNFLVDGHGNFISITQTLFILCGLSAATVVVG